MCIFLVRQQMQELFYAHACSERPAYGAEGLGLLLRMVYFLYNIGEECLWPLKTYQFIQPVSVDWIIEATDV